MQISVGYDYLMELSQQSSKLKALPKAAPSVPSLHALSLPWSYDHSIKNFVNVFYLPITLSGCGHHDPTAFAIPSFTIPLTCSI